MKRTLRTVCLGIAASLVLPLGCGTAQEPDVARREGQEIVGNAQQIAGRIQSEAREEANRDRERGLERARAEIQLERDRAIADLRGEFADITVAAA